MTNDHNDLVQLVTRVPRSLKRQMKLHCLVQEVAMMDFIVTSLTNRLAAEAAADTASNRRARGASA